MKFNLIIHQSGEPPLRQIFHTPEQNFKAFHISAHLQGHYNSVRRGDDPVTLYQVPFKTFPIGYDFEKVKSIVSLSKLKRYQKIEDFDD